MKYTAWLGFLNLYEIFKISGRGEARFKIFDSREK